MAMFKQSINQQLASGIEIVVDHESNRMTPVCIAWKKDEDLRLVGTRAKIQAVRNCKKTFFNLTRLLGLNENDMKQVKKELVFCYAEIHIR